jgi:ribosome-binding protein aMBF1 (putative translation factor)
MGKNDCPIYQDWEPVVLRKPKKQIQTPPKPKPEINGGDMPEEKLKKYTIEMSNALATARQAKNMTQKELAKNFNMPTALIANIENGSGIYNKKLLSHLLRSLGVDVKPLNLP